MIEGHGDDLHRYAGRVRYNFSSNILQTVDHTGLMSMLASRPELISGYPEPAPLSLERRLDSELGLPYGSTMVTAGATDAIYMMYANPLSESMVMRAPFTVFLRTGSTVRMWYGSAIPTILTERYGTGLFLKR